MNISLPAAPATPLTWLSPSSWRTQHLMLLAVNWHTMCRNTRATHQTTCPHLPSFFRQHQTSCLLPGGPLARGPFPHCGGGWFFPLLRSLPPSAWALLQWYWIPALWVKAGRLPTEEMLWKWDLPLLCRGTGYFRIRLCWRYGLRRDYCSCYRKCCCIQSFPISKTCKGTLWAHRFLSSLFGMAFGLTNDRQEFPQPQRSPLPKGPTRPSAPSQKSNNFHTGLSCCQSEGSKKECGNRKNSSGPGHV